ncbi:MAG: DUF3466 family protein [Verrucomicrobia bacterium]|nr:DUF3466 family protein [Verrucomicrobiota bacterium]
MSTPTQSAAGTLSQVSRSLLLSGLLGALHLPAMAASGSAYLPEPFRLPELGEFRGTAAFGINEQLDVVGWESEPGNHGEAPAEAPGFLRRRNGEFERFTPPNGIRVAPSAINNLGVIVGSFTADSQTEESLAFKKTGETYKVYPNPEGVQESVLVSINDAGDAVGYRTSVDGRTSAYLVKNDVWTPIDLSSLGPIDRSEAYDINSNGDILGVYEVRFNQFGFLKRGNQILRLEFPGSDFTSPSGLNSEGTVVGNYFDDLNRWKQFIWREGVFTPLAVPGFEFHASDINDAGVIVGYSFDPLEIPVGLLLHPAALLERGHTDAGLAYEDGEFEFHIHDGGNDVEYAVDEAVLAVGTAAEQPIPDALAFSFLGRPGYSTWVLPAVQNEELLLLGLAAEEIETGIFVDDQIRVELVAVEGNGNFALYSVDALGLPLIHMNTSDGYDDQDAFTVQAGSHVDLNWAFSAPGTYRVGFRARATLVEDETEVESKVAYYTFTVPEPLRSQPVEVVETIYTITDLGTLGGPASFALDVNESAQVTGNARYTAANSRLHAFTWDRETIRDLGYLTNGVEFSRGYAINDAGVIVGESDNDKSKAFLWDGTNMVQLGTLGGSSAVAHDINNAGEIVGASSNGSASRPYKRDAAGMMHDLGTLLGTTNSTGRAWGINQSGAVVGISRNQANTTSQATLWIDGSISNLGSLAGGSFLSQAYAINDNGVVVGSSVVGKISPTSSSDLYRAFVWKDGVMSDLGAHSSNTNYIHTEAKDINNAGDVVGYAARFFNSPTTGGAAMLWREGEAIDLNTLVPPGSGWLLQSAEGINDRGDIVGYGSFQGQTRAFLLRRATIYTEGHADFAFDYADGVWDQRMRHDDFGPSLEPNTILIRGTVASQLVVPSDLPEGYEFLGNVGDTIWILPEVQDPRLPFLGLAAEETPIDTFLNRDIRVQLRKVEGPGQFIASDAGFNEPRVFFNTRDGIGPADFYPLPAGSHAHLNWLFTRPGYYRVTLQASGVLTDGDVPTTGSPVTYHFQIIGIETRLKIVSRDGGLKVVFTTQTGVTYHLERAPEVSGPWENTGQPFVGTGREKEISVPPNGGSAFFRINASVTSPAP